MWTVQKLNLQLWTSVLARAHMQILVSKVFFRNHSSASAEFYASEMKASVVIKTQMRRKLFFNLELQRLNYLFIY